MDKPVRDVHNLVRGSNPRPGAWTTIGGDQVEILDARTADGQGEPGELLEVDGDRFVVATSDGALEVTGVRADGDKLGAGEFAERAGLRPGGMLGSDRSTA